jgi:hypothetical protein
MAAEWCEQITQLAYRLQEQEHERALASHPMFSKSHWEHNAGNDWPHDPDDGSYLFFENCVHPDCRLARLALPPRAQEEEHEQTTTVSGETTESRERVAAQDGVDPSTRSASGRTDSGTVTERPCPPPEKEDMSARCFCGIEFMNSANVRAHANCKPASPPPLEYYSGWNESTPEGIARTVAHVEAIGIVNQIARQRSDPPPLDGSDGNGTVCGGCGFLKPDCRCGLQAPPLDLGPIEARLRDYPFPSEWALRDYVELLLAEVKRLRKKL